MRDLRILPAVLDDVAQAADWYDREGFGGLGDRFIESFQTALGGIQRTGEAHRTAYQGFRKILLRPFPYQLFYRLHDEIWIVTLVIHAARDPKTMREQLAQRGQSEQE